jgi:hypothetical protein
VEWRHPGDARHRVNRDGTGVMVAREVAGETEAPEDVAVHERAHGRQSSNYYG